MSENDTRNVLLVYGRRISMPPSHTSATLDLASEFGVWSQIIDITEWSDGVASAIAAGRPILPRKDIGDLLGEANEILTHTLWRPFEQYILDMAPGASIKLFDNGLDSHNQRRVESYSGDLIDGAIRTKDLRRVEAACYTLGDMLPVPDFAVGGKVIVPTASELRDHWSGIAASPRFREQARATPVRETAVLIGTSFYRLGKFTAEDEADAYAAFARKAGENGLDVVWKSHPRAGVDLNGLQSGLSAPLRQSVPIELLPCLRPVSWSASISSTALLTLKKVYGIPYRLLGSDLSAKFDLPWLSYLTEHAAPFFPEGVQHQL